MFITSSLQNQNELSEQRSQQSSRLERLRHYSRPYHQHLYSHAHVVSILIGQHIDLVHAVELKPTRNKHEFL